MNDRGVDSIASRAATGIGLFVMLALLVVAPATRIEAERQALQATATRPPSTASATATVGTRPTLGATATAAPDLTALAVEKGRLENLKLRAEIGRLWRPYGAEWLLTNGAAALAAIAGLFAVGRWIADRRDARAKGVDERFQSAVEGLGSERAEARVQAAAVLLSFLQPGYERFYKQVFDLAAINLNLQVPETAGKDRAEQLQAYQKVARSSLFQALIHLFREAFPRAREVVLKKDQPLDLLDASSAYLAYARLARADFDGIWMLGANLTGADLRLASLRGANLAGASFALAKLAYTQLDPYLGNRTNLVGADFSGATLESVDLEQADLTGAKFDDAVVSDVRLVRARLQGASLEAARSLKGTNIHGAKGLSDAQRKQCLDKGAVEENPEAKG